MTVNFMLLFHSAEASIFPEAIFVNFISEIEENCDVI